MRMDRLSAVAEVLGTTLHGADADFSRVVIDSRQLQAGDLFVALKGERFDGHSFVAEARSRGAVGAIVAQPIDCALPQILVRDTLEALQLYAAAWRRRFHMPVVAVTGSNGKTTTKQLLAAIFAQRGPVLATQGNFNNQIGLPLTLLNLRDTHETAVIEMGAGGPGDIALLTRLTQPDVGVVTQAGDAHLEGFGSREGVARGKGELFSGLQGGVAVINADDAYAPLWRQMASPASVLSFGFADGADVRALNMYPYPHDTPVGTEFELRTPMGSASVRLPLPGRHNVANALAAAACAVALGMEPAEIARGLAAVDAPSGRLSWKATPQGARLLDDTYNANPTSLRAGLELLAAMKGQRCVILGGMAELGADASALHAEAGRIARSLGIERLFTLGPLARAAAEAFGPRAEAFDEVDALVLAAAKVLTHDTVVLVKGSRSSRMERVVAGLTGSPPDGEH